MHAILKASLASLAFVLSASMACAAEEYTLTIKDHKFSPETLEVPANQKIMVHIDNQDSTSEEFESHELSREKVIHGNNKGVVSIGPLKPGSYKYIGEFHEDTAKGVIVAK